MSFSQTGSTIQNPYANKANSFNPYANSANSGSNTTVKSIVTPPMNTAQTQATQAGLMNNKTFNGTSNNAPIKSTPNSGSVVDYLNGQGKASDYNSRANLATQYGISGYTGTADQNTQLLGKLQGGGGSTTGSTSQNSGFTGSSPIKTDGTSPNPGMINLGNTQPQYKNDANLYPNVVTGLANAATTTPAITAAQDNLNTVHNQEIQDKKDLSNRPTDQTFGLGEIGMLNNLYSNREAQAQAQVANALTGQQNQITALNNAGNLAKPMLANYGQQVFNPTNGTLSGETLNDAVNQVVAKLQSGQMSYADAQEALSGYGQGGTNALLSALPAGFNVAQSNTLANQQGSITPAYNFAKSALTNLQSIAQKLSGSSYVQGSNIPLVNSIGNFLSTQSGVNSDLTRQYTGAIQEARNAYAQLLASSKGGTPTEYTGQSTAAIPDNATPNDIQAAINNLESLGQSKVDIYSNPGNSNSNASTQVGSLGTYNFVNGQWVYSK